MANAQTGTNYYVDSTGSLTTNKQQRIAYIILTSAAVGDTLTLRDSASGSNIITVKVGVDESTEVFDFSAKPLLFPAGIYVQAITSGAFATIVTV